jgi:hypothetical protein
MAKALYHSAYIEPVEFEIGKRNKDGTVDLHDANGAVVVRSCQIGNEAKPGEATEVAAEPVKESEQTKKQK